MLRFLAGTLLCCCCGWGTLACSTTWGQVPAQGQPVPAFAPGLGLEPDQAFERMFGPTTPEEQAELDKINVSVKEETDFGKPLVDAYLAELRKKGIRVLRKGGNVEYLQQLVDTLQPMMQDPKRYPRLTVLVIDSPDVDARSFAGGTLVFYRGLLSFSRSEAALMGIVGHELSHLDRGHLVLPIKRAKLLQQQQTAGNGGFDPQQYFNRGTTIMRLMGRPFRPEDEAAADVDGATWAYRAGYDPRELADLFARLQKKNGERKVPFGNFFRTHPYNSDRHEALLKLHDNLQLENPQQVLYVGKKNLTQRTPKSVQEFPE